MELFKLASAAGGLGSVFDVTGGVLAICRHYPVTGQGSFPQPSTATREQNLQHRCEFPDSSPLRDERSRNSNVPRWIPLETYPQKYFLLVTCDLYSLSPKVKLWDHARQSQHEIQSHSRMGSHRSRSEERRVGKECRSR